MWIRSGVKDENNNCIMEPLPAGYTDMTGCLVEEYDAIGTGKTVVEMEGCSYEATHWCDVIRPESAEAIAVYGKDFYAGKAAVTRNSYGKGTVYYVGTVGLPALCRRLAERMLQEARLPYIAGLPERVEVTTREGNGRRFTFIFNNDDKEKAFLFEGERMELEPFEMKILEA